MKPHYIAREPGLAIPFIALVANVLALLLVAAQLQNSTGRLNMALQQPDKPESVKLVLSESGVASLNGSAMASIEELEFHLSALAAGRGSVSVQIPANVPAQRLSEVLRACNHSGFTDVALHVGQAGNKR